MITIAIAFILYLALMIAIGFKFYSKTDSLSDYFLGGRNLGSWLTALSAQASDMSGWLLIGLPGTAYVIYAGTSEAIWTAKYRAIPSRSRIISKIVSKMPNIS